MSKIIDVKIDWMEGWGNSPRVEVLFDKLPSHDDMLFEERDNCYLSVDAGGYANFWYWNPGSNNRGMAGHEFDIKLRNGSKVTLRGPWSSNSQAINSLFETQVMEASVTDKPNEFSRGYTFLAAAVTIEALLRYLEEHPASDWRIGLIQNVAGEWYNVVRADGTPKNADDKLIRLIDSIPLNPVSGVF
jgi:hypothetical protein